MNYEPASWEGEYSGCQLGVSAFWAAVLELLSWLVNSGCYNDRPVTGGSAPSLHREGRARDLGIGWPGSAGYEERRLAMWGLLWRIVDNHEQLGVQQIIFNGHIWRCDRADEGWRPFSGGNGGPHHDHAHVEFTWHAARTLTVATAREILTPVPQPQPDLEEDDMPTHLWRDERYANVFGPGGETYTGREAERVRALGVPLIEESHDQKLESACWRAWGCDVGEARLRNLLVPV